MFEPQTLIEPSACLLSCVERGKTSNHMSRSLRFPSSVIFTVLVHALYVTELSSSSSYCFESDFDFDFNKTLRQSFKSKRSASRFPAIFVYPIEDTRARALLQNRTNVTIPLPSTLNVLGSWECMYLSEVMFLQSLVESNHVTTNPSEVRERPAPPRQSSCLRCYERGHR